MQSRSLPRTRILTAKRTLCLATTIIVLTPHSELRVDLQLVYKGLWMLVGYRERNR